MAAALRLRVCADVPVGGSPGAFAAGDFNGDGVLDVAVVNHDSGTVSWLRGVRREPGGNEGCLVLGAEIGVGMKPVALATLDYDGDGFTDLVVVNETNDLGAGARNRAAGSITYLRGGEGGLERRDEIEVEEIEGAPQELSAAVVAGDFDDDGFDDVVVANSGSNTVTLLNGGPERMQVAGSFPAGFFPVALSTGDYNGDGVTDVAIAARDSDSVVFALGGAGGLFRSGEVEASNEPSLGISADHDGDGVSDLAVGSKTDALTYFTGGPGGLAAERSRRIRVGDGASALAIGDFDANGDVDLAVAERDSPNHDAVFFLSGGAGGLVEERNTPVVVGSFPSDLATGHFDGDCVLDVVTTVEDKSPETLQSVRLLRGCVAAPAVCAVAPSCAPGELHADPGTDVPFRPQALIGGDFDGDRDDDVVVILRARRQFHGVALLRGGPDGLGDPDVMIATGDFPLVLTGGDFNGDDHLDVVVAARDSGEVFYLEGGEGGLSETRMQSFPVAGRPVALAAADYDGDGFADIAVAVRAEEVSDKGTVTLFRGSSSGLLEDSTHEVGVLSFADRSTGSPQNVVSGDFNSDGFVDLVVVNQGSDDITLLLGSLEGLRRSQDIDVGEAPAAAAIGDFDGDSVPDLAVVNEGSSSVTFLRQRFVTPHANELFVPGGGDLTLIDPRFPRRYRLELEHDAFAVRTTVALVPATVFPLDPRRIDESSGGFLARRLGPLAFAAEGRVLAIEQPRFLRVVTDPVRLLPEDARFTGGAKLTLRLRDATESYRALRDEVVASPANLRVFRLGPRGDVGARVLVTPTVGDFDDGVGVVFAVRRGGRFLVALERGE